MPGAELSTGAEHHVAGAEPHDREAQTLTSVVVSRLDLESEVLVPVDRSPNVGHVKHWHDLLLHLDLPVSVQAMDEQYRVMSDLGHETDTPQIIERTKQVSQIPACRGAPLTPACLLQNEDRTGARTSWK